jgi:hypothetical protein
MQNSPYIGGIYKKDEASYILSSFNRETNVCTFIPFSNNELVSAMIVAQEEKHLCNCVDYWDMGQADPECNTCGGSGVYYLLPKIYFAQFTFVAHNMREFLIKKFVD